MCAAAVMFVPFVHQLVIHIFLLIRLEGKISLRIGCAGQQEAFLCHKVFQEGVGVLHSDHLIKLASCVRRFDVADRGKVHIGTWST